MEESFEKLEGVEEVISGYSGGITKNPTYREVTHGDSGHFEVVEIIYDKEKISYEELLKNSGSILIHLMHMANFAIKDTVIDL